MILEHADIRIDPSQASAFEEAIRYAQRRALGLDSVGIAETVDHEIGTL